MIEVGKYRLHKCDEYNWCIEEGRVGKTGKSKGAEIWGKRRHYTQLQYALLALFDDLVADNDKDSVGELMAEVIRARVAIVEAVSAMEKS